MKKVREGESWEGVIFVERSDLGNAALKKKKKPER